jgi:molybdenum cofactor guanylyltransferase
MHSVAILAGGDARRFGGRDKSVLVVDGRTIRERQIGELSAITDDILIVARPLSASARDPLIRATADAPKRDEREGGQGRDREAENPAPRLITDLVPGCGPLGGLHAALTAARGDALFLVACDMPYVTAPLAIYLLTRAEDADIVVPRTDRGYHPLCAVYRRACLPVIVRRLAERRLKMLDLLHDMRVCEVTADDLGRFGNCDRLLANVNTPAEYAGLEALQGHKK